ncbi:MAG: integrase core domain-containing protein [Psychromonas sp.]|nr:integrase core domain-containing protein [Psychromonas sp.]
MYSQRLKKSDIIISIDGKDQAKDNLCVEIFLRSSKCERIDLGEYKSIKDLQEDAEDHIKFYNDERFHEALKYRKPINVYRA